MYRNVDCQKLLKGVTKPPTKPPNYVPTIPESAAASSNLAETRTTDGMTKPGAAAAPDDWEKPKGKRRLKDLRKPGHAKESAAVTTSNSHAALAVGDSDDENGLNLRAGIDSSGDDI